MEIIYLDNYPGGNPSSILSGSSRGSFSIFLSKTDLPSDFVELGSEILYLFLQKKWSFVVCLFVCFVLCNFVRVWLTFFEIEVLIELRKMLLRKKLFDVRFGNCLTPKVPRFCRFTKMQLT